MGLENWSSSVFQLKLKSTILLAYAKSETSQQIQTAVLQNENQGRGYVSTQVTWWNQRQRPCELSSFVQWLMEPYGTRRNAHKREKIIQLPQALGVFTINYLIAIAHLPYFKIYFHFTYDMTVWAYRDLSHDKQRLLQNKTLLSTYITKLFGFWYNVIFPFICWILGNLNVTITQLDVTSIVCLPSGQTVLRHISLRLAFCH